MPATAQTLRDNFADREVLTTNQGRLDATNSTATLEPGEPRHGGKPGGHSLWISWIAQTNGVARFRTEGSGFDTLLSAYYLASTNEPALGQLVELARADDSEGLGFESRVEFGALAGDRYEMEVTSDQGYAFNSTTIDLANGQVAPVEIKLLKLEIGRAHV